MRRSGSRTTASRTGVRTGSGGRRGSGGGEEVIESRLTRRLRREMRRTDDEWCRHAGVTRSPGDTEVLDRTSSREVFTEMGLQTF